MAPPECKGMNSLDRHRLSVEDVVVVGGRDPDGRDIGQPSFVPDEDSSISTKPREVAKVGGGGAPTVHGLGTPLQRGDDTSVPWLSLLLKSNMKDSAYKLCVYVYM